jgi:hypothetical protein
VQQISVLSDGARVEIPAPSEFEELTSLEAGPVPAAPTGPTRPEPLGTVVGARSGDKGGAANIGVWVRTDPAFCWLASYLTVAEFRRLLPETAELPVTRYVFANLRALNFVVEDVLGAGVAANVRHDPQAKAMGEWLRSRVVDIPEALL